MTRRILPFLAALCLAQATAFAAPDPGVEARLIGVLQSNAAPAQKAEACKQLRTIGTAKSVPALAALLTDEKLAQWARVALEPMPAPEAGAALCDALAKTSGPVRVGILNSLGERKEAAAVEAIGKFAADADDQTAMAAATALGKIGTEAAIAAVRAAGWNAPMHVCLARGDAILSCADRLLAAGDRQKAAAIYDEAFHWPALEHIRVNAYRGMVLSSNRPAPLLAEGLAGEDRAALHASLSLVRLMPGKAISDVFRETLPKLPPDRQVALLEGLRQRGDRVVTPAVVQLLKSPDAQVRLTALDVLSTLGDASTALTLAQAAAQSKGAEQEMARQSLALLKDEKVCESLLTFLPKCAPAVQAEIVRALGSRREAQAVPALLKMAGEGEQATRLLALKSVAMLADGAAASALLKLLTGAADDAQRDAAELALIAACGRDEKPEASVPQVLSAMKDAPSPVRASLLRVAGRLGGAEALQAMRAGLTDKEAAVQDAALRTMAEYAGLEAAPDLLKLAKEAPQVPQRVIALRGYWRLVGAAAGRSADERWNLAEAGFAAAQRPEEKKLGLTELAKIPHPAALKQAETLAADEAVRTEAEAAAVQIAAALGATQPTEAKATLKRLSGAAKDERVRQEAAKALGVIDQYVGYITSWLVAGPYRQEGKQCQQLFDIAFAPEKPDAKDVKWQPAPAPTDPSLFWQADVLSLCSGDQCVLYLKTRVFSPKEQKVRLDMGSDDGIKLWVSGKLVHSNNTMRPIQAGQDKTETMLKEGWNDFLVKLTQNNMGCAVCVRVRGADGAVIDGLKFEAK